MAVSRWLRTDGGARRDPKEKQRTYSQKEMHERVIIERSSLSECADSISITLTFDLTPKDKEGENIVEVFEKKMLQNLIRDYKSNIEIVANCMKTRRRNIWAKLKKYSIEVDRV